MGQLDGTLDGSPVVIQIGIWWHPPTGEEPILYASLGGKTNRPDLRQFQFAKEVAASDLDAFTAQRATRIYMPAPAEEDLDLEREFNTLLDELERQLERVVG